MVILAALLARARVTVPSLRCVFLTIKLLLVGLVLLWHVSLDELGDEVAIGAMTISDSAEPVDFVGTLLHVLLRCQRFPVWQDL